MTTTSHPNTGAAWADRLRGRFGRWNPAASARAWAERCAAAYRRMTHKRTHARRRRALEHADAAIALYNEKRYSEAEQQFRDAVGADDAYARAHYGLGNSLAKQGKQAAARHAWMRAAETDPNGDIGEKARRKLRRL